MMETLIIKYRNNHLQANPYSWTSILHLIKKSILISHCNLTTYFIYHNWYKSLVNHELDKFFESLFFLSLFSMIEIHTIIILQEIIVIFYSILSQQLISLKLLGFTPRSFNILEQMKNRHDYGLVTASCYTRTLVRKLPWFLK